MYEVVKLAGLFIRQFCLPNPFEPMWPEQAFVLNWAFGLVLLPVSYFLTSLFYKHGDGAANGSALFNLVYLFLSMALWGVIKLIKFVKDNPVIAALITVGVIVVAVSIVLVVRHVKKKNKSKVQQD